ncbi:MAG: transposase [Pseudomonadota bacterium]
MLSTVCVEPIGIYPGSPWENDYNELFNRTLRQEVLNTEWFTMIGQERTVISKWLWPYNQVRPHQALNMRPPVTETLATNGPE